MPKQKRPLTEREITNWLKEFRKKEGHFPTALERKMVPGQPTEKWASINSALVTGGRGLPGGNSLARIRNKLVGLTDEVRIVTINTIEVEPERTQPLVPDHLLEFLPRLSLMERSILTRYLEGENQQTIGELYGVTQAAVSYRIGRAIRRLHYIEQASVMADKEFEKRLRDVGVESSDVRILSTLRRLTSQSATATELEISQGVVRYTLYKVIRDFGYEMLRRSRPLLRQLELMRDNPAILVDISRSRTA